MQKIPRLLDCVSRDEVPYDTPVREWGGGSIVYTRHSKHDFLYEDRGSSFVLTTSAQQQFYPVDAEGNWTGETGDSISIPIIEI